MTKIKKTRESMGLSQEYIAKKLNISLNGYQKIEAGKVKCNIFTGLKLSILLKTNPFILFGIEKEKN